MNKRLSFAIWIIIVGVFCICFLGGFFLTSRLARTNESATTTSSITPSPPTSYSDENFDIAVTDIDGRLVLGKLKTGDVLSLDIKPFSYEFSPDSKWLTATDFQKLWLINTHDGSVQQIAPDLDGLVSQISWSPKSDLLAFWADSKKTGFGVQILELNSQTYRTLPGTESYNSDYGIPVWSFDQEWIILYAYELKDSEVERDVLSLRVDGTEKRILNNVFYGITPYPSPIDHKVAFSTFNNESSMWELYISDFTSLDSSLHQIKEPEGRQFFWIKWLSDGSGFYALPFNWGHPEVDLIDSTIDKIEVIWSDTDDIHYPGDIWSPRGTKIINPYKGLIIFDVATKTFSEWREGLINVCGIRWEQDDEIFAVVVCEASGELPVSEMSIIFNDGTKIRLGDDLYGGVVQISPAPP